MKAIASRTFTNTMTAERIVARIYPPSPTADGEWSCRLVIRGLPEPVDLHVPGADSVQALDLALQGVRYYVEKSGLPIRWSEVEEVGDYGLYRPIMGFDVRTTRRLEKLVLEAATRLARAKVRSRRKSKRRRS